MTQGDIFNTMCIGGNGRSVHIWGAGEMIWVLRYELA